MNESSTTIFWFRRDLRLGDNCGLHEALKNNNEVLPIFIFDKHILNDLPNKDDARITFIYEAIQLLKHELEKLGTTLQVYYDNPEKVFSKIEAKSVYTNHDYEPYARERDKRIKKVLNERGITFETFKDQVIFEKLEIAKSNGEPYSVYTPYSKKWKKEIERNGAVQHYELDPYIKHFVKVTPMPLIRLEELGFNYNSVITPTTSPIPFDIISNYHNTRDLPGMRNGTTRLGIHLRFGTLSIRKVVAEALKQNETYLNELIWREFYMMILWNYPEVVTNSFRPAYDKIPWRNDEGEFEAWCNGETGYPMVDAGMRELNQTGFMHNRARMVVASFLTKHLLIDWRWGEAYFADKLLDYELASNNGGWQWAAGSGCDAAPYFRIFNPLTQAQKFDPSNDYITQWVPEYKNRDYQPMIDHKIARQRALNTYKKALNS